MRRPTIALAALLLAVAGCSTPPESDTPAAGPETTTSAVHPEPTKPGKYEQTWLTPYSSTTCGDYLTALDDHQRWVLAADMLSGARKVDGATDLPEGHRGRAVPAGHDHRLRRRSHREDHRGRRHALHARLTYKP
ncbi:hypothetical protein MBT42_18460 [Streptomyces sp. MBT42]|uniref:hypothetical protein n=1 Tax=Streptomyces sp. MBT42 TaxID=1488373 RepID=UPI001E3B291D|nr:hypothetical protein [Streptomyces sp. MBT42]MCD2465540.1 hypothetical protein [Streptomyces sp. MBT42]